MKEERYSIIFSSKTGNTAELANAIRDALPQENCDYFGTSEIEEPVSEMLYIGFWADQGNADKSALELLQRIKNKKVFLFGTAGFGENEAYFQKVLNNVKSSMDESNQVVGEYMCQGKMPQAVRDRYVKLKEHVGTHTKEFAVAAGGEEGKRNLHASGQLLAMSALDVLSE